MREERPGSAVGESVRVTVALQKALHKGRRVYSLELDVWLTVCCPVGGDRVTLLKASPVPRELLVHLCMFISSRCFHLHAILLCVQGLTQA